MQHVSQSYQKMTSRDTTSNGMTAGARCMSRSEALQGWLNYILYTSVLVWIRPRSRTDLIFPHNTVQHIPISNGMLDNISAWKQRCTVLCCNKEHNYKQCWLQHCNKWCKSRIFSCQRPAAQIFLAANLRPSSTFPLSNKQNHTVFLAHNLLSWILHLKIPALHSRRKATILAMLQAVQSMICALNTSRVTEMSFLQ